MIIIIIIIIIIFVIFGHYGGRNTLRMFTRDNVMHIHYEYLLDNDV